MCEAFQQRKGGNRKGYFKNKKLILKLKNPVTYFQGLELCLLGFIVGKLLDLTGGKLLHFPLNLPITMFQDERQNSLSSILIKLHSSMNGWRESSLNI